MKIILLVSVLVIVTGSLNAQKKKSSCCKNNQDTCIIIDALNCCNRITSAPKCIHENSILGVKIININPFKTSVSALATLSFIDFGNDSLFTSTLSSLLQPNDTASSNKASPALPLTAAGGRKKKDKCCDTLQAMRDKQKQEDIIRRITECNKKFQDNINSLTLLNRAAAQLQQLFDTTFITKTSFTRLMWGFLECAGISKKGECCNCKAHQRYQAIYIELQENYDCIKKNFNSLLGSKKQERSFSLTGILKDDKEGVTVSVKDAKGQYAVFKKSEHEVYFDKLTALMNKITSDSVKKAMLESAEYIDNAINKLCDSVKFEQQNYISDPIIGDYITVTPFVKKLNGDTVHLKSFPSVRIKICGGHRANVSLGISFSFLGMNDDDYVIKRSDNDSTFSVIKAEKGIDLYIPSVTSFVHFYNRSCGSLQHAATIGASINPTNLESLRIMGGYSLIFGEERRAIFSIGVIAGAVNRLDSRYDRDKQLLYKDYPALQETDLVKKRFRVGMFVGLSYNLSKQR